MVYYMCFHLSTEHFGGVSIFYYFELITGTILLFGCRETVSLGIEMLSFCPVILGSYIFILFYRIKGVFVTCVARSYLNCKFGYFIF